MHIFKTTNIKGKDYVEVNQRLLFFRNEPTYAGWSIESDLVDLQPDRCCIKAMIRDADGRIRATGHAHEDRTSSMINKTSYVENCETSAFFPANAKASSLLAMSINASSSVVYSRTNGLDGTVLNDWYMYFFEPFVQKGEVVLTDLPPYNSGYLVMKKLHSILFINLNLKQC